MHERIRRPTIERAQISHELLARTSGAPVADYDGASLRTRLLAALTGSGEATTKESIRLLHTPQRRRRAALELANFRRNGPDLLQHFANGTDISPSSIRPRLVHIGSPDSLEGRLFRVATLLWSVPVSRGYGRRLRFLIVDDYNSKLIGLLALGDPVFNLAARDAWIGWDVRQRESRLSNVMDAYVLGSVPPYSALLGAKAVGALAASAEIRDLFDRRYGRKKGIISNTRKHPKLVLLTTTSALGRSSIYNRLRLPGVVEYVAVGSTQGWGHFLIPEDLFTEVRQILRENGDSYSANYNYGQGPNWKLRALKKAFKLLGLDESLLRHGVKREVYTVPLAMNWREILMGSAEDPAWIGKSAEEIGTLAVNRWMLPRSERRDEWRSWRRQDTWDSLTSDFDSATEGPA